jgi:hypothetical protein
MAVDTTAIPPGSEPEPGIGRIFLARGDDLGLSSSQTFSSIVGNGAVDHGAAVDAFPCIEDQKEIREPLQHQHPFALRTFH